MMRILVIVILGFIGAQPPRGVADRPETLIIENVGVADRLITPMVISTSQAGLDSGRATILRDNGVSLVVSHIASSSTMRTYAREVESVHSDKNEALQAFGTLRFVLHDSSQKVILLRRTHAVTLLRSLEANAGTDALRKDLIYLRYQVSAVQDGPDHR